MQKISTFLWFDNQAEEAAKLYTSLFKNSKITDVARYSSDEVGQPDTVMTVAFVLEGQEFTALNGGPRFPFTEAISLVVNCESQEEVDKYWNALTADGGEESMCGWLKDKFGVSWQIVPTALGEMMSSSDREAAGRATHAMLQMRKLDISKLQEAYNNRL